MGRERKQWKKNDNSVNSLHRAALETGKLHCNVECMQRDNRLQGKLGFSKGSLHENRLPTQTLASGQALGGL